MKITLMKKVRKKVTERIVGKYNVTKFVSLLFENTQQSK